MSYNIKLTDYSLLPKRAFPLDARSHFKSFAQANKTISGNVTTVENSSNTENDYKQFYIGEIITTTTGNTWKVNSISQLTVTLYCNHTTGEVKWGSENSSAIISSFKVRQQGNTSKYAIYDGEDKITEDFLGQLPSTTIETCLVPFSGSGDGGGVLTINATAPLNYDSSSSTLTLTTGPGLTTSNGGLTLSLDSNSGLTVSESGLTLKIDSEQNKGGLVLSDNGLSLSLAPQSGLTINNSNALTLSINEHDNFKIDTNNKLTASGTHFHIGRTDTLNDVPSNNYIYQEI